MKKKKRLKPLPAGVRYIVTAVNTLSGERERISNPTTKEKKSQLSEIVSQAAHRDLYWTVSARHLRGGGREILGATI